MADELIALKPEIVAKARVTEAQRAAMYDAAAKNPEAFWREEAQRIAWMKAPTKIKSYGAKFSWSARTRTNTK